MTSQNTTPMINRVVRVAWDDEETWGGVIETTQFQDWKTVALLTGLGFIHFRDTEVGRDEFLSDHPVTRIYDGWTPSKDGSRLISFEDLSDPESPHYGRQYITAYRFTGYSGHDNVVVWHSSSSSPSQLYSIIGLGDYARWKRDVIDRPGEFGLVHWLKFNPVCLSPNS